MSIRHAKRAIRRGVISRNLRLSPADRARQEAAIAAAFAGLPGFAGASTVLLFVSAFAEEFDTTPMLEATLGSGKRLVCPRVNRAGHRLDLFEIQDLARDLEPGTLGIREPRVGTRTVDLWEIDWALVPGVAFDDRGFRIGRGAGHYDRLLPRLRANAPRWSLGFDEQLVEFVPDEPHDQPVTGFVSPGRILLAMNGERLPLYLSSSVNGSA